MSDDGRSFRLLAQQVQTMVNPYDRGKRDKNDLAMDGKFLNAYEHFVQAEVCMEEAEREDRGDAKVDHWLRQAQVHALLGQGLIAAGDDSVRESWVGLPPRTS